MFAVVFSLLLSLSFAAPPLTSRVLIGATFDSYTLVKTSAGGASTTNNSLVVAESLGMQFDWSTFEITSTSWQSSSVAAAVSASIAKGVAPFFVLRSTLPSLSTSDISSFNALITRLGQYLATLPSSTRVYVALEVDFNAIVALRTAGTSFANVMTTAASSLKSAASAVSVRVGQGWLVSRTVTLHEQLAEFRSLTSSGALSADTTKLDFVAPIWRFVPADGTARLSALPCQLHALVRFAKRELAGLETLVPYLDIINPAPDVGWLAAGIALSDALRGIAPQMYFDGLRGIGMRAVVCVAGGADTTACAVRADRTTSGAVVENTLLLKGDAQAWRSWLQNERTTDRTRSLSEEIPRFTCGDAVPIKSGLVYLDSLISWDAGAWGWVDASTSSLTRNFSSTGNVHDGKLSLRVRFDSVGQRLRFEYRSAWPLSPLGASEFTNFVFDIYAESVAPIDLPITVRVDDSGSAVSLSSVATRIFGADMWQRIVIPRASLLASSGTAGAVTLTVTTPPTQPLVLYIDRMAFDAVSLACDFTQPQLGCNPLVLTTVLPTPPPPTVVMCGNGVVEGNEQCDGGLCCTNCMLKPAGLPCGAARANDQCDLPDSCDGISGGCKDKLKPVGTACNDGDDRCTVDDQCRSNGKCAGRFTCPCSGSDALCETDLDRCTTDKCVDNMCSSTPTIGGIMCDDRDPCTGNDVCDGKGSCRGTPGLCSKPTPRPPPVGPPAGCKPGQSHLCTCQLPDDYCVPPLTCKEGICYRPELMSQKPCVTADWGKVSGCPCEPAPSLYCKPPLTCDTSIETCIGGGDTPANTSPVPPSEVGSADALALAVPLFVASAVMFNLI